MLLHASPSVEATLGRICEVVQRTEIIQEVSLWPFYSGLLSPAVFGRMVRHEVDGAEDFHSVQLVCECLYTYMYVKDKAPVWQGECA